MSELRSARVACVRIKFAQMGWGRLQSAAARFDNHVGQSALFNNIIFIRIENGERTESRWGATWR